MQSFGSAVFSQAELQKRLSPASFEQFLKVQSASDSSHMTRDLSSQIAAAMLEWSLAQGATHYCHWFQPLTGGTAEKHDSFLDYDSLLNLQLKFSGSALMKGEADASSLPNGSVRSTFEARGYTVWDSSSPCFVKQDGEMRVLCIPTAFCAWDGSVLDEKTPVLRASNYLSRQAMRILKLLKNPAKNVVVYAGPEQEYFLISKQDFAKRDDLRQTGRTLFGCPPAKSQQLRDQYYGSIRPRVLAFMAELNTELYKLGVPAKTQHNEVAPSQHELAVLYTPVQVAMDQNQIVMETMKKTALKHDLQCLLHEKPFQGVNGSGKHNNWSFGTDLGENLLEPGHSPGKNLQFLVFFVAVIAAVDRYQKLLRLSTAYPANEHRLGGHEAPPSIISVFIGQQLENLLDNLATQELPSSPQSPRLKLGVDALPQIPLDNTDRNRTSPLAFTGNKFEFRAVGSSQSIGMPNVVLCAGVGLVLEEIANKLTEKPESLPEIIALLYQKHKRIIFNGNGYSDEWIQIATQRGLYIPKNCVEVYSALKDQETISLFEKTQIFSENELSARQEINFELYANTVLIEADCMVAMSRQQIIPVCTRAVGQQTQVLLQTAAAGIKLTNVQKEVEKLASGLESLVESTEMLENVIAKAKNLDGLQEKCSFIYKQVQSEMLKLRQFADWMEAHIDKKEWPLPSYADMLFYE